MSTNALITIIDEDHQEICRVYKHWDGYPDGLGAFIFDFIEDRTLTNGIPCEWKNEKISNGMWDFAAQFVATLKEGNKPGDTYLLPRGAKFSTIEYSYEILPDGDSIKCRVYKVTFDGISRMEKTEENLKAKISPSVPREDSEDDYVPF